VATRGARVLVLGVAFKKDIDDARNSPAERVIEALLDDGAEVTYHDPYVPTFPVHSDFVQRHPFQLSSVPLTDEVIAAADCVVIVQAHSQVNHAAVAGKARAVVDCCNALAGLSAGHITRLGVGDPFTAPAHGA
jgi:UDP-N-acetyl-D-glucosamine dehydrogenase